ncbi:hypothetical protein B9Z55_008549 [Caenorhabditis nigoni]|uniref:Uncharacterized protein n=1 Tax=Caenorhabditis nigoni TaxID=1611254 RepID=A0A2G5UN75_9PELO|nr:hypothetical protein B9Z55_008549 [Caenorhabditis nigoni]
MESDEPGVPSHESYSTVRAPLPNEQIRITGLCEKSDNGMNLRYQAVPVGQKEIIGQGSSFVGRNQASSFQPVAQNEDAPLPASTPTAALAPVSGDAPALLDDHAPAPVALSAPNGPTARVGHSAAASPPPPVALPLEVVPPSSIPVPAPAPAPLPTPAAAPTPVPVIDPSPVAATVSKASPAPPSFKRSESSLVVGPLAGLSLLSPLKTSTEQAPSSPAPSAKRTKIMASPAPSVEWIGDGFGPFFLHPLTLTRICERSNSGLSFQYEAVPAPMEDPTPAACPVPTPAIVPTRDAAPAPPTTPSPATVPSQVAAPAPTTSSAPPSLKRSESSLVVAPLAGLSLISPLKLVDEPAPASPGPSDAKRTRIEAGEEPGLPPSTAPSVVYVETVETGLEPRVRGPSRREQPILPGIYSSTTQQFMLVNVKSKKPETGEELEKHLGGFGLKAKDITHVKSLFDDRRDVYIFFFDLDVQDTFDGREKIHRMEKQLYRRTQAWMDWFHIEKMSFGAMFFSKALSLNEMLRATGYQAAEDTAHPEAARVPLRRGSRENVDRLGEKEEYMLVNLQSKKPETGEELAKKSGGYGLKAKEFSHVPSLFHDCRDTYIVYFNLDVDGKTFEGKEKIRRMEDQLYGRKKWMDCFHIQSMTSKKIFFSECLNLNEILRAVAVATRLQKTQETLKLPDCLYDEENVKMSIGWVKKMRGPSRSEQPYQPGVHPRASQNYMLVNLESKKPESGTELGGLGLTAKNITTVNSLFNVGNDVYIVYFNVDVEDTFDGRQKIRRLEQQFFHGTSWMDWFNMEKMTSWATFYSNAMPIDEIFRAIAVATGLRKSQPSLKLPDCLWDMDRVKKSLDWLKKKYKVEKKLTSDGIKILRNLEKGNYY